MSLTKPLLRALAGVRVDPPPLWIMRQAGRYLPEYRAVRERAGDFLTLCFTPELAAEVTLQPIRRFGFDTAIVFADILLVPYALGSSLAFPAGGGPRLSAIRGMEDVDALCKADAVRDLLSPVCETLRLTGAELPAQTALLGFAGSPWTVATYMAAGHAAQGQRPALTFMREHPQAFEKLIQRLTAATIEYLSIQIDAGADAVKLFDTWSGTLAGSDFRRFVTDPTAAITGELKNRYPKVPVIAFPRQAGAQLACFAAKTGADCIALDHSVEISWAKEHLPMAASLQGNLDPRHLVGDGSQLAEAAHAVLDGFSDKPHIFNLGHGITPDADIGNVARLVDIVRAWDCGTH